MKTRAEIEKSAIGQHSSWAQFYTTLEVLLDIRDELHATNKMLVEKLYNIKIMEKE